MGVNADGSERRYVRSSDRRLAELAAQAATRFDLDELQYRRCESTGVMTEHVIDGTIVTATSVIECSLAEMRGLLASPTSERYAWVMRELVGRDFIYGTIVHHAKEVTTQDVTVRTAAFLKRHMLARNEQWCFICAHKTLEKNQVEGFTVTMASQHPDDVFSGKVQAANVVHVQGLTGFYLVTAEPQKTTKAGRTKRAVRVTFCAHVPSTPSSGRPAPLRWLLSTKNRPNGDDASSSVMLARVMQFARSLKQYQNAVRWRRLDAQVFADLRKVQPTNTRCACCTRRVDVIKSIFGTSKAGMASSRRSKRCHLCGFLVCARCVRSIGQAPPSSETSQSSETGVKYSQAVHVCEHCMQRIDDADYDSYCATEGSTTPSLIQPDGPNVEPASAVIAHSLSQVLSTASEEEKSVVVRVIKHIISSTNSGNFRADTRELTMRLVQLSKEHGFSGEMMHLEPPIVPEVTPEVPSGHDLHPVADGGGRQYELQHGNRCENSVADTEELEGAQDTEDLEGPENDQDDLDIGEVSKIVDAAHHPKPADESQRLRWIEEHPNIVSYMMNLPDLELLCNIACGELKCDAVVVTLIGPQVAYVVASTEPAWRGGQLPRDHTICAHVLMNDYPLLVPHPEADVRFSSMNLVRRDGIRFYFGFPIKVEYPEGGGSTAVGTFCCIHVGKSREVSESQYALMATLAGGVTRVMESRAASLLEG
uniref:GAF domain-containing protein n=1 Tax=Hyaloperonospora arabidopsidis (strain Emoy2) TaxID=559515 RepID=M4BDA6_HYAAE